MNIKRIALYRFRNVPEKIFEFSNNLTIILGENARGKTNILEAIHCLVNGEGFRESKEEELIEIGKSDFQLDGIFSEKDKEHHFRIILAQKRNSATTKSYFIEKTRTTQKKYVGEQTKVVLFAPEQVEIITGAPSLRRNYFDRVISSFDYAYKVHLSNYEQALRRRNKILEKYQGNTIEEQLSFWDDYLIQEAEYISLTRQSYIDFLNARSHLDGREFAITYEKNVFSQARLEEKKELELIIRKTLIGPQKDEFIVYLNDTKGDKKNIQKYGSRSEQRLGIFWLKMNEIHYMEEKLNRKPILLLDDVFSEFDQDNKQRILRLIEHYQTIMTTTEKEFVKDIKKTEEKIHIIPV